MQKVMLVGLGGFLGAIFRYGVSGLVGRLKAGSGFPFETLVVNVLGCVAIGLLAGWGEARGVLSAATRAFLFVGLLGGFTTFSTLGFESFQFMREGQWPVAALSIGLQVMLGIGAVWVGHSLARLAG